MLARVPPAWDAPPNLFAVVVPVQLVETWLLCLKSYAFPNSVPEHNFDRRALKRAFWGELLSAGDDDRVVFARALFWRPGAIDLLLQRKSFAYFANQVSGF